jgi:hypothetical protein
MKCRDLKIHHTRYSQVFCLFYIYKALYVQFWGQL